MTAPLRIGGGSAFFNDRLDAALELVEHGRIDVLMIETLAERTLAMLQAGRGGGQPGYFPRLANRLATLLPACHAHGTRLVSNGGGADTGAAAAMAHRVAGEAGLRGTVVAAVTGDDVAALVRDADPVLVETGEPASRLPTPIVSANAYLGAAGIAEACRAGAHVVLTGRVTDSALALGPLQAHFGWTAPDALASGIVAGHLLECGGQATGGYFADPGVKEGTGLDRLGFPIAEVAEDRSIRITKPPGTGGRIDRHVLTEQLLYEVHDPARYITPDVVLDLTSVRMEQTGPEEVRLTGMRGHPAPDTLKVLIGVQAGQHVEVEISYAGTGAQGRAELAADIVRRRLARGPLRDVAVRYDLMGLNALALPGGAAPVLPEARLRVAARCPDLSAAELLVTEVESLYVNGPAGGGGVRFSIRPAVRTLTTFLPAADVPARVEHRGAVMAAVTLHALAHSRTGDKGDSQTLSVIAYDEADYELLRQAVTAEAVAAHFRAVVHGPVTRYELPLLFALHFVLERALAGGVNDSLALDTHGKSRSSLLLDMSVDVPDDHWSLRP